LKAQINPHFFFNTLNNLYALALENSPKTPATVMVLSNLMRYVIYDAATEKIVLSDEVKYIENYLELQKIRLLRPENVTFEVNVKFVKTKFLHCC
ncbi:MAG: histidine kinase, partial [Methylophilaceae bacterium]